MKRIVEIGTLFALAFVVVPADAMPIGVRTLLHCHAVVRQLAEATPQAGVSVDVGGGKSVTVPQTWLDEYPAIVVAADGDKAKALNAPAANGRLSNVECYVLGLDPEDETNDFRIVSFPMGADGKPDLANIVFDPPQSTWNVSGARAVLMGAEALDDDWHEMDKASEEDRAKYRFYKMVIELP